MAGMVRKILVKENCMNKECLFWRKKIGDHCGNLEKPGQWWRTAFCDRQKKGKKKRVGG